MVSIHSFGDHHIVLGTTVIHQQSNSAFDFVAYDFVAFLVYSVVVERVAGAATTHCGISL